jgi:hypothetical protein
MRLWHQTSIAVLFGLGIQLLWLVLHLLLNNSPSTTCLILCSHLGTGPGNPLPATLLFLWPRHAPQGQNYPVPLPALARRRDREHLRTERLMVISPSMQRC